MAKHNQAKLDKACTYLQDTHNAEWCATYGEPGYSDPERGIILANWNNIPKGLADWLEKCGYSLEWSDEWTIDYNHGKAYRTSPDSYHWESQIAITDDGEMLTPDDDASEWIDEFAMTDKGQPCKCLPSRITDDELTDAGFVMTNPGLESGWFPGQTDNPDVISRAAFDHGNAERVVFRKTENSQFYMRFECWVQTREDESSIELDDGCDAMADRMVK